MKKVISVALAVTVALSLTACSAFDKVIDKGAEANDEAIRVSLTTICQGASVGSVKRQFNTPELVKLYNQLCKKPDEAGLPEAGG